MVPVRLPDARDALHGGLVADLAAERVAGVGGIDDHAATAKDFNAALDQSWLRIDRMDGEVLAHYFPGDYCRLATFGALFDARV